MSSVNPAPILDLLEGFRRSKVMFAASSLGVFDALDHNPLSATKLAAQLNCNASAMERLLNACVSLGLLTRSGNQFSNTPLSGKFLVSEVQTRFVATSVIPTLRYTGFGTTWMTRFVKDQIVGSRRSVQAKAYSNSSSVTTMRIATS